MTQMPISALRLEISTVRLPRAGFPIEFAAGEREREWLARQLGVLEVTELTVDLRAFPWRGDGVRIGGRIGAGILQKSVVSLEPVAQRIDEPFAQTFVPEGSKLARIAAPEEQELHIDPEGEDPPELFSGDRLDLGAYVAEAVALALDPYPRKAGERFGAVDTDPAPQEKEPSPFEVLAKLSPKPSPDED
ncbi:DUF177 domain-containing protein [Aurantimonas sp. VKM B-3413]|uniref:YceD family protein n=1 Tax=Aurantimonas sp. VKM B-3413 TaxID=2779401 RepID=UPI001E3D0E3D|nr:DUF177 domain-containing protein [Aurantimonas sp. VKM B-3413]MCB8837504.1 DUF177 domain-containing protein [Aurantimonas sp. VKM B-3413]